MARLSQRIVVRGGDDHSHLSDEEITARIVAVCEEIERQQGPIRPDWRELVSRGDLRLVTDAET